MNYLKYTGGKMDHTAQVIEVSCSLINARINEDLPIIESYIKNIRYHIEEHFSMRHKDWYSLFENFRSLEEKVKRLKLDMRRDIEYIRGPDTYDL
jgi:hypothetical protein